MKKYNEEEIQEIYRRAKVKYGTNSQLLMVVEECAELQQAIMKKFRKGDNRHNILEEYVDVLITTDQLASIMEFTKEEVETIMQIKIHRLNKKLEGEKLWKQHTQ